MRTESMRWGIYLLKFAVFTIVVTAGIILLRGAVNELFLELVFLHVLVIGSLCWLTIPHIGERTEYWAWPLRWATIVSALLVLGTIGTIIIALTAHYVIREVEGVPTVTLFLRSLQTSLPMTVLAGVVTTVVVAGNDRLVCSEAALQEQRLQRERAEKVAAEAQLASLASRVQPHFLFNTLNSIAALIRENPAQAEETLERLASLLRSSLENSASVPLEQELKLVRDYLEIQKMRLGDRLSFEISADSTIRSQLPAFSIQTLVENSIKHVAGQRQAPVHIHVRASLDKDVLITVSDDGPGFDPTVMKTGGGLDILQARLRSIYGDHAELSFDRQPGRMTIRIRVPA